MNTNNQNTPPNPSMAGEPKFFCAKIDGKECYSQCYKCIENSRAGEISPVLNVPPGWEDGYEPIGCDHMIKKGKYKGLTAFQFFSEDSGSGPNFSHCVSTYVCPYCGAIKRVGHRATETKVNSFDEIFDLSHPDAVDAIVKNCNYMNRETEDYIPYIKALMPTPAPEVKDNPAEQYFRCKEPSARCPTQCDECLDDPTEQPVNVPDIHVGDIPGEIKQWIAEVSHAIWEREGAIMEPGELADKVAIAMYHKMKSDIDKDANLQMYGDDLGALQSQIATLTQQLTAAEDERQKLRVVLTKAEFDCYQHRDIQACEDIYHYIRQFMIQLFPTPQTPQNG